MASHFAEACGIQRRPVGQGHMARQASGEIGRIRRQPQRAQDTVKQAPLRSRQEPIPVFRLGMIDQHHQFGTRGAARGDPAGQISTIKRGFSQPPGVELRQGCRQCTKPGNPFCRRCCGGNKGGRRGCRALLRNWLFLCRSGQPGAWIISECMVHARFAPPIEYGRQRVGRINSSGSRRIRLCRRGHIAVLTCREPAFKAQPTV